MSTIQTPAVGYYNIEGKEAAQKCPLGQYTNAPGQTSCSNCEQGVWCNVVAVGYTDASACADPSAPSCVQQSAYECPPGFYCPSYDTIVDSGEPYHRVMCPTGTYSTLGALTGVSECTACPATKACEKNGDSTAEVDLPLCAEGFFCKFGSPNRFPETAVDDSTGKYGPCPAGHYCAEGTEDPEPCPAGTFSMQERAWDVDFCIVCPPGFMCETTGLTEPTRPTTAGIRTVDHILEATACSTVSKEYCPIGTNIAQQCLTGYYQDQADSGNCKECPAGSFCVNGSQEVCKKGYYCE